MLSAEAVSLPMLLHKHQIERFAEQGYLVVEGLLSASEVTTAGHAVDDAVASRNAHDKRKISDKTTYEQSFIQCMRLWEDHTDVRAFTFNQNIAQAAAELLEVQGVRLWQDQALYKEAGGRETTAHQDQPFWPIGDAPLISAWIPFDAVTLDSGAMGYVPGSHKAGRLTPVDITHQSEPYDILNDPAMGGRPLEWVEVPAGAVIFHHGYTVHAARANHSEKTRRVMTMVYFEDGRRRLKPWPVFGLDRDNIAVGDIMAGPGLPMAWPRNGTLPAPPAQPGPRLGFGE